MISAAISCVFGLALAYLKTHQIEPAINTLMYTSIFIGAETLNNFFRKFKLVMITAFSKDPDAIGKPIGSSASHSKWHSRISTT